MYLAMGNSCEGLRWPLTTDAEYDAACARCEIVVVINTDGQRRALLRVLRYDKRPDGARGRALTQDLNDFHPPLRENDRLEPGGALRQVGDLEDVGLPAQLIFWRSSNETIARHRCPLLCAEELGLTPTRALTVDALHTASLGIF